jgi:ribose transport system ATP-binding protein
MNDTLLNITGLTKHFPGVRALHDVDLTLAKGEVLAVIGENGAGKSTLMKILAGVQMADAGEIQLDGEAIRPSTVRQALDLGIALIHQELNLADNLSVAANIYLGREPRQFGMMNFGKMRSDAGQFLKRLRTSIRPDTPVSRLSIGHQQMVEIAKALSTDARILIMDEPTSSLSQHETEQLYEVIADLRESGVSVIYISHRLGEVRTVADRVVVLRDGENAGALDKDDITHDNMVRLMVGRDVSNLHDRTSISPGDTLMKVRGLQTLAYPGESIDFELRAGEIVGIGGLVGAGRTEILETLFGVMPRRGGTLELSGKTIRPDRPEDSIASGMALIPEDRKQCALVLEMAVRANLNLARIRQGHRAGIVNRSAERETSAAMIDRLAIRTPSDAQAVQYLSGGNQQKVVLGKWLALNPRVLLLDEPTRGIDVGSKQEIYELIEQLAREGAGVLFVSSEMEELLGLADRILVVHDGAIAGELSRADATEESVMHLATGSHQTETANV